MSAPMPEAPAFPRFTAREALPSFLLGWGLGAVMVFGVRWLAGVVLKDACAGHTALALLLPLVLGPGGLMFTAFNGGSARRAAMGLGFVVASLLPALYTAALDIGKLRSQGCAGGYLVVTDAPGGRSVSRVQLRSGESRTIYMRIGGFQPAKFPGDFKLQAVSQIPQVGAALPAAAKIGQTVPVQISVKPNTPVNVYTLTLGASQGDPRRGAGTTANIDVDVRP